MRSPSRPLALCLALLLTLAALPACAAGPDTPPQQGSLTVLPAAHDFGSAHTPAALTPARITVRNAAGPVTLTGAVLGKGVTVQLTDARGAPLPLSPGQALQGDFTLTLTPTDATPGRHASALTLTYRHEDGSHATLALPYAYTILGGAAAQAIQAIPQRDSILLRWPDAAGVPEGAAYAVHLDGARRLVVPASAGIASLDGLRPLTAYDVDVYLEGVRVFSCRVTTRSPQDSGVSPEDSAAHPPAGDTSPPLNNGLYALEVTPLS